MSDISYDESIFAEVSSPYSHENKAKQWDALKDRGAAMQDIEPLALNSNDILLDIGCGAGYHALTAADLCQEVHAVDISSAMIDLLNKNLLKADVKNVWAHSGGFLSADFSSMRLTKAFSWGALHHLPDAWKTEALIRIADALPLGGTFLLMDLVYSFHPRERSQRQKAYISELSQIHGEDTANDLSHAFREEYVTYHQVLLWMLNEVGFTVKNIWTLPNKCWSNYLCVREDY